MNALTRIALLIILFAPGAFMSTSTAVAAETAVYPLQILQPQPNLTTHSRYYKAYPGLLYKVPVGVFGGAYPFTYSLLTAPSGMSVNSSTGIISWPNPTTSGSPHPVTVNVTDAAGTTVSRSWTITVTTQGFLFVDGSRGTHAQGYGCSANCGTGTIDNPFKSMNDFYQASGSQIMASANDSWRNGNFLNHFVYWRAGTYGLEGAFNSSGQQFDMLYRGNSKPHVWLAYPGETVVIDHAIIPGTNGAFFDARDGDSTDFYIQGITFRNMRNHAWRIGGYDNHVFFENRFENLGPGRNGDNSSFLMWTRYAPLYAENALVKDNVFDRLNVGAFIKTYSMRYALFEGNIFTRGEETGGSGLEGIAIKNDTRYVDVRGNSFDGNFGDGAINGNWNACGDLEIRFNKILNAPSQTYSSESGGYVIQMNHDTGAGPAYVHRNTMEGSVVAKFGNANDGPFRIYDNVIVNENSGTPVGSHISHYSVAVPSIYIATNNLAGSAADNIIDANGNLTAAYAAYIGSRGHQLGSGSSVAPNISVGSPTTTTPTPVVVPVSTASVNSGTITTSLYQGLRGAQVVRLQTILSTQGYLGSTNVTGYFGPLTAAAVRQYQCAKGIVCSGTPQSTGYGFVGAKTRAALNSGI